MKVAIVGAGIAGMTAAYELAQAGREVTVFEAAPLVGGLASGFRDEGWAWPLERFYHHIFATDTAIIELAKRIGCADQLFFRSQMTAQWWQGRGYDLNGPLQVLRFPALPFVDRVRFGAVAFYLKYVTRNWRRLEQRTAAAWTSRYAGPKVYATIWRPLLEGKFGPYADEVNMAWLWARLRARSFKLGYFVGGFQAFCDHLLAAIQQQGVQVHLNCPISSASPHAGGWRLNVPGQGEHEVDQLLVTGAPGLLSRLAPQLPRAYLGQLSQLRSMGAVVLTLALKQSLTGGIYWLNLPKDQFPYLALVEHTNFVEAQHYGGDHLIYLGDYVEPEHAYFQLSQAQLLEHFLPSLQRINPAFEPSWIRASWLHRERYAQPIVPVGHSHNIPPLRTPLPGLYWASMSQVYPWDRGTNFAVEIGQRVAGKMLE
ncbi:NAD(P)/FAD-dependent oxidoreductase [Candidatus Viridilinea mediisalina]|uniref:Oxidoreductase n=1 Tax=Candidatus Viridilinea mediisalina TaxID=2024553 RepID=A0A2A6RP81_9CHLR|nr:NAD(P)/FAD-dependent oxidoreductase [Candidatus Viridilinea mediisalina]PDW04650.1 oxidoreductase [Candidatus Viridilinea mediisalina]